MRNAPDRTRARGQLSDIAGNGQLRRHPRQKEARPVGGESVQQRVLRRLRGPPGVVGAHDLRKLRHPPHRREGRRLTAGGHGHTGGKGPLQDQTCPPSESPGGGGGTRTAGRRSVGRPRSPGLRLREKSGLRESQGCRHDGLRQRPGLPFRVSGHGGQGRTRQAADRPRKQRTDHHRAGGTRGHVHIGGAPLLPPDTLTPRRRGVPAGLSPALGTGRADIRQSLLPHRELGAARSCSGETSEHRAGDLVNSFSEPLGLARVQPCACSAPQQLPERLGDFVSASVSTSLSTHPE